MHSGSVWEKVVAETCEMKNYIMYVILKKKYIPLMLLIAYRTAGLSVICLSIILKRELLEWCL